MSLNSPGKVAIVGLGPSINEYISHTTLAGGRSVLFDEVWAINAAGGVIDCDMVFHMDDMAIQEIRAKESPGQQVDGMLKWLKTTAKPVMTSRTYPRYPATVSFPLEEVIRLFGTWYFNSTAAYAVAYAIYRGATEISLFGFDFTYPGAEKAERGRACVEYYLGWARAKGITIALPSTTSLMDSVNPGLYGYDTLDVGMDPETGKLIIAAKDELPTAAEMERRYDHNRHPNPLVERKT